MLKKDQFYKDILDGLSLFYESRFIKDIRNTALKYPTSSLGNALNRRQTASKLWLLDSLNETHGGNLGSVHILGGWCGVLASLLFHDSRFKVNHITSFDIDPSCAPIADSLNADAVERRVFSTETADILQLRYTEDSVRINDKKVSACPDLLINTSCEHLEDFDAWFRAMPQRHAIGSSIQRLFFRSRARELPTGFGGISGTSANARAHLRRRAGIR